MTKVNEVKDLVAQQKPLQASIEDISNIQLNLETIRKYLDGASRCSPQELGLFLQIARASNLNPFKREIHLIKYGSMAAQIITGYEVYLKRAERSGKWGGMKAWIEGEMPNLVGKVEIYRKDWDKPLYHEVYMDEVAKKKADGSFQASWASMPRYMLKKVAIAQALRWAFPDEIGGLPYTRDEIVVEAETAQPQPEAKEATAQPVADETDAFFPAEPVAEEPQKPQFKDPNAPVTEKQVKKIFAVAKSKGLTNERIKARMITFFKKEHTKDLTMEEAGALIDYYTNYTGAPEQIPTQKNGGTE